MMNGFQKSISSGEVNSNNFEAVNKTSELSQPSMSDLKTHLENIISFKPNDEMHIEDYSLDRASVAGEITDTIILEDGTVVEIISPAETVQDVNKESHSESNVDNYECNITRELTEDEKENLKDSLGWSDKQISKCSIDENNVIHYKTDREDLEGKTSDNGIRYERKTVDIHGIKVQGVFPVFDSICDVQLPSNLEKASNAHQFKECNRQLKEYVETSPETKELFSDEQLEEIEDDETPSGYVWHHNEETGKMQLVKIEDHDRTQGGAAHTGGKALWGGSYSSHEVVSSNDVYADSQNEKNMEV